MAGPTEREKKSLIAVLYFDKKNSEAFKELAKRCRAEMSKAHLVWSTQFRGPESIFDGARAVIIQEGCVHADRIYKAYSTLADDIEFHWATKEGNFVEDDKLQADSAVQETEAAPEEPATTEAPANDDGSDEADGTAETILASIPIVGAESEPVEADGSDDSGGLDEGG